MAHVLRQRSSQINAMRIATFNLHNLRLRRRQGQLVLDGAVDRDFDDRPRSIEQDVADRKLTAQVIAEAQADIIALQEVFDAETLEFFYDHFLLPAGAPRYPTRICLPGNDGRGLDVAVLSKTEPEDVMSDVSANGTV